MSRRGRIALLVVLAMGLALAGLATWLFSGGESAIDTARGWARLAPLPKSANRIKVDTRGGSFSREFVVRFDASRRDVEAWLGASAGTTNVRPQKLSDGGYLYKVLPAKAEFAEVQVSRDRRHVRIRTYSS